MDRGNPCCRVTFTGFDVEINPVQCRIDIRAIIGDCTDYVSCLWICLFTDGKGIRDLDFFLVGVDTNQFYSADSIPLPDVHQGPYSLVFIDQHPAGFGIFVVFYFRDDPDSFFADIVGIEDIYSAGSHSEDFIIYRYQIFDRSRYGDIFQRFAIRFHSPDTHQLSLQIGYDSFCRGNGYDLAWKSRLGIEDCTDGTERFGIYNLDFFGVVQSHKIFTVDLGDGLGHITKRSVIHFPENIRND